MDQSAFRRGRPTIHVRAADLHRRSDGLGSSTRFGDAIAVLCGDVLLAEAHDLIAELPKDVRAGWRKMVLEVVYGQVCDIAYTAGRRRSAAAATRVGRMKSGRYTVRRPLELGAMLAQADTELLTGLGEWGDLVGDAFALRDDIIGTWGDPSVTGKPTTDDLRSAKPTLLLSWATDELRSGEETVLLRSCDAGTLDDVGAQALASAMTRAGLRERAELRLEELLRDAADVLDGLTIPQEARRGLAQLAQAVGRRST